MLNARRLAGIALVASLVACGRSATPGSGAARSAREAPPGDGVWFEDGLGASETEVDAQLRHAGFATAFLPALRLSGVGGAWTAADVPPPPRPFGDVAVFLVVAGGPEVAKAAAPADAPSAEAFAATVSRALRGRLEARALYGAKVAGVHLDLPFAPASAAAYGTFLKAFRAKLPPDLLLTVSLRFAPAQGEGPRLGEALGAADGLVAFVFGEMASASPVRTDEIGKPWWAAYSPAARGVWKDASGQVQGTLPERLLLKLADDPRVDLSGDLTFREEAASAFLLSVLQPVRDAELSLRPGDRVSFRQPALSEMLTRFGADLAGRRRVRGRIVAVQGRTESERIFTLAALSDVILGHSLDPDLRVFVSGARTPVVTVLAQNASVHASVISRTLNWVDVDLPAGSIRDVQPGGFDRYDLHDAQGRAVTPGRATRVRFYETLLGPSERVEPARILLHRPAPADCCRHRQSVVSAAGREAATDWIVPTPAPTPVPHARPAPRKKSGSRR